MDPVNLGRNFESMSCAPVGVPQGETKTSLHFPSVYLESLPEGMELPRRGRVTFEYELCSSSENYKDEKTSVSMDLLQLVSATAKASDKKAETGAQALDKFVAGDKGEEDDSEESDREEYAAE